MINGNTGRYVCVTKFEKIPLVLKPFFSRMAVIWLYIRSNNFIVVKEFVFLLKLVIIQSRCYMELHSLPI